MILKSILFVLIAVAVTSCSVDENLPAVPEMPSPASSPAPEPSKFIDFRVSDVRLGDNEKPVINKLGRPKSRRVVVVDDCGITEVLKLNYPGLEVQLDKDLKGEWSVLELIVTSNEVSIEPRVKIGDELEKIKTTFENPYVERTNTGAAVLYYSTRDNDNAQLEFKNNKLSRVRLYINPC